MMGIVLLLEDRFTVFPLYIELIVSHTRVCFFGLKTDCQALNSLYCENELMHYGRRSCGCKLVLVY